jgi:5-methylthioadenosine/S-adenosylhomocysteine deaminase
MFLDDLIIKSGNLYMSATMNIRNGIIQDIAMSPLVNLNMEHKFLVTPGFVNCHIHPNQLMDRGLLDLLSVPEILSLQHIKNKKTNQDRYLHALFVLIDSIKSGATSIYSFASNPLPVIKAYKKLGAKGAVTCVFNDIWEGRGLQPKVSNISSVPQRFSALYQEKTENIDIHIGSDSLQSASNEMLKMLDWVASEYNTKVNIHISEGKDSVDLCLYHRKTTPVRLLNKLGVLNSNWNLIHSTNIDLEEVKIISENKANVILCAVSNLKTGAGIPLIEDLMNNCVNIGLGTDACSNNNTNNILNEAYVTMLLSGGITKNPHIIDDEYMLKCLTINGYKILGFAQVGSLKIGQPADLLLWSLKQNCFTPVKNKNYCSSLFYNAPDIKPHSVIIMGNKVVENYKFLDLNEDKLRLLVNR